MSNLQINEAQFDQYQAHEIRLGLEKGLDVSVYANPEFTPTQMAEIREGLEKGLDVSVYAHPEFGWEKMKQIRLGLTNKEENK